MTAAARWQLMSFPMRHCCHLLDMAVFKVGQVGEVGGEWLAIHTLPSSS